VLSPICKCLLSKDTEVQEIHGVLTKSLQLHGLFYTDCEEFRNLPNVCSMARLEDFTKGGANLTIQCHACEGCRVIVEFGEIIMCIWLNLEEFLLLV
jgi:hypothetical protein